MSDLLTIHLTPAEAFALNTLCELEMGGKPHDRIEMWPHVDTAQDKILDVITAAKAPVS